MNHVSSAFRFLVLASLSACAVDSPTSSTDESESAMLTELTAQSISESSDELATSKARIRIVHASAEAPAVDIYAVGSSTPAVVGIKFGETSPYLALPTGSYAFQVRVAGSSALQTPLYTTPVVKLETGKKYAAIAAGNPKFLHPSTAARAASAFRVLALEESYGPSAPHSARVRIVHGSADAPTVGIDLGDDDAKAPEVSALNRFSTTDAAGVSLPAGQALQVGIVAGGNKVTAFTTPALPNGGNFLAIAVGQLGSVPNGQDTGRGVGLSLLVVGPSGSVGILRQNPLVYALHASADAPSVDIFAGPARVYAGLSYGSLSTGVRLPPGNYNLDIYGAGGSARPKGSSVFNFDTGALKAGERYLAVANGFLVATDGEAAFNVAALSLKSPAARSNESIVTFLHALPDAPFASFYSAIPTGGSGYIAAKNVPFGGSFTGYPRLLQAAYNRTTLYVPAQSPLRFTGGIPESGFVVATGALTPFKEAPPRIITVDAGDISRGYNIPWVARSLSPVTH